MNDALTLVPYQTEAVHEILDHIADFEELDASRRMVVLDSPTGSGKTLMVLSVACGLLQKEINRKFDSVLVLTPAKDIREGFTIGDVVVPGEENSVGWSIEGEQAIVRGSTVRAKWITQIRKHLTNRRPGFQGSILVATQAAGVRFFHGGGLDTVDWSRILLIIDEAHHVSVDYDLDDSDEDNTVSFKQTAIGQLCSFAMTNGASVLMGTATPFRGSSEETIYPPDARLVKVTYTDYMEQLGAPGNLSIELVGPKDEDGLRDLRASTENRLSGEGVTRYVDTPGEIEGELSAYDAGRLATRILKDGKRRSKIFVKIGRVHRTDENGRTVRTESVGRIVAALEEQWPGVRITDGTGLTQQKAFLDALHTENGKVRYADSETDVFIVCGRGCEGTNWKFCSHFYYVGFAGTVQRQVQVLGRTTRTKRFIPDYPEELRDHGTLVMFVPNMTEELTEAVRKKWHAGALLSACFINSHEVAREFMDHVIRRIRTRARKNKKRRPEWVRLMSRLNHAMPTPVDFAKAEQFIGAQEIRIKAKKKRDVTVPELVASLRESDLTAAQKAAGVLLTLSACEGQEAVDQEVKLAVRGFVKKVLAHKKTPTDEPFSTYLFEAFEEVATKWNDMTSMRVHGQIEIESKIQGTDPESIARDLRAKILPTPPFAQAVRVVEAWYTRHPMSKKIHGDLSRYFGRPKGSYSARRLKADLIGQKMEGQPEEVENLDDVLWSMGL